MINDFDTDPDPIASSRPFVATPNVTGSVQNDHPKLDWNNSENAEEYEVWRRVNSSGSWGLWTTTTSITYTVYLQLIHL